MSATAHLALHFLIFRVIRRRSSVGSLPFVAARNSILRMLHMHQALHPRCVNEKMHVHERRAIAQKSVDLRRDPKVKPMCHGGGDST